MGDWQFASKQGNLKWTSPVIPDKGTLLFSALSPTLLLGYRQKGELFPVEYVKLADICRVSRSGEKGIELEKLPDEGSASGVGSVILVVADSPSSADDWYSMINIAKQDSDAAAEVQGGPVMGSSSSSAPHQTPPTAAAPPPAAGPQAFGSSPSQSQPAASDSMPQHQSNANPATAPSPAPLQPESSSSAAPQYQQRQLQGFAGPADSTEPSRGSLAMQQQQGPTQGLSGSDEQCQNSPSGAHEFRPLTDVTKQSDSTGHLRHSPSSSHHPPLGGGATATTTTSVVQEHIRHQQNPQPSMARPLPSQSPIQTNSSTSGLGAGDSSMWGPGSSRLSGGGRPGAYVGVNTTPHQARAGAQPPAPGSGIRPRSGMMVSMPATQSINRNIAPNLSSMWKEWDAPDGCTYLLFEPKGTLLKREQGQTEFVPYVEGNEALTDEEFNSHPYATNETMVNLNNQSVRNLQSYGHGAHSGEAPPPSQYGSRAIQSPSVYRTEVVASPRGQYSPSRRTPVSALANPREAQAGYTGRRVHRVQLGVSHENPGASVIQHEVEPLGSQGLTWDPSTNEVGFDGSRKDRSLNGGNTTAAVQKQWHEIRTILMRGRYFKKHAVKSNTSQNRMVFLTSDNSYVCAVPTSAVLQNASRDPGSLTNVAECVQYYGPDTRAMALNEILSVTMGADEDFVYNRKGVNPDATFCIVSKKHAFVLECRNSEEAQFFCDSWNFFLFHSKPINPRSKRTPQMIAPVTHGTRTGIQF